MARPPSALASLLFAVSAALGADPELPRHLVDTTLPPRGGHTIAVAAGGDLQGAIDAAQPGDTVTLHAGATYRGPIVLPAKRGDQWIVIRTSAGDDALPPPGRRLGAGPSPALATIVTPDTGPALKTAPGAHHYRLIGIEFTLAPGVPMTYGLVQLGDFEQSSAASVPHHLILDRVFVHGRPDAEVRRGVAMNAAFAAVVDSQITEIHEVDADTQAIGGSTGPGPIKIVDNTLEAAGENVMFGGYDPQIRDLVPSDIEIRGNYIAKPPEWRSSKWTVKNLLELKNARRVLIDGNLFEHNWPAGQSGFAILFTVRNQDGAAPWAAVEDVTFTNNVVRQVPSAINILGFDDNQPSKGSRRIAIRNNLFDEVGKDPWGGRGAFLQLVDGTTDVTVENNTIVQSGEIVLASGRPHTGFVFRGNVAPHNQYGFAGDDHFGDPAGTIAAYLPGAVVTGNVIAGGDKSRYPKGNAFVARGQPSGLPTRPGANSDALATALAAAK